MRFLVLLVCSVLAQPALERHPAEQRFADTVSESALRKNVRDLVRLGPRMGGTPSGDTAAAFLAGYFKQLGLDVQTFTDPAEPSHWEENWRVELAGRPIASAWPYGFSPSIEPGGRRTGRLRVVENLAGAKPDESWRGAVIYTPSAVGRNYPVIARSAFRPLAILTSAPNAAPYTDWTRIGELPGVATNPIAVFGVSMNDGRTLAGAERSEVTVALTSHVAPGSPKTIVATLPGGDPSRYYLVCAHGDSDAGGPGADDNASGVSTVMEMARVFATLKGDGQLANLKHPIRFAVWGTEYQSPKAYIAREGAKLSQLAAVFNFDETGTGAERDAIYFESNEVPWNADILHTLERVAADYADQPGFWTEYTTNPSQGGTDSYAFLPRKYRGTGYTSLEIPSTTIYTAAWDHTADLKQTAGWDSKGWRDRSGLKIDYSRYYHSSADTPENTTEREPQNMVRAVKVTGLALLRIDR